MSKTKNDSTITIGGLIYQFIVALDKCFELGPGQSLFIETYGDVTIFGNDPIQIETKYYKKDLTDLDLNVWKTLYNWMQDDFEINKFKSLILLTTQNVKDRTIWYDWNELEDIERYRRISNINATNKSKSKVTNKYLSYIFDSLRKEKLIEVVKKFTISHRASGGEEYYNEIVIRNTKHLEARHESYIQSLMGYILKPDVIKHQWEINYESFIKECNELTNSLIKTTKIFPTKTKFNEIETEQYSSNPFVEKIRDIEYSEVINDAIKDFVETKELIYRHMRESPTIYKHLEEYGEDIRKRHLSYYRKASRQMELQKQIDSSKSFYDDIIANNHYTFYNYNSVPLYFYSGLIHILADDNDDILWLLNK